MLQTDFGDVIEIARAGLERLTSVLRARSGKVQRTIYGSASLPPHRSQFVTRSNMIVTELSRNDDTEPVWDAVGIHGCDFRPHFDGDLHNVFTTIYPLNSKAETEQRFRSIAREIAEWILAHRNRFGRHDRFQIIVGWPLDIRPTGRQVIKTGGDFATIERLLRDPDLIQVRSGWSKTVFAEPESG